MKRCVGVGVACLGALAVLSARGDEPADEQKAVEAIRKAGGVVQVDEADPAKPAVRVDLAGDKVSDADLAPLEALTHLRRLNLDGAHITDAGLAHVQRLGKLQKLYLAHTPVTDAGLARLEDLTRLEVLDLAGAAITDAGLAHLEDMPKLQVLDLSHTQITGAGLAHLKKLDGLRELYLVGDKPEGDKGSEFEEKVLEFQKAQPQVKVVR
jgi:Leucine rich repeat/Leucine Rich repeat